MESLHNGVLASLRKVFFRSPTCLRLVLSSLLLRVLRSNRSVPTCSLSSSLADVLCRQVGFIHRVLDDTLPQLNVLDTIQRGLCQLGLCMMPTMTYCTAGMLMSDLQGKTAGVSWLYCSVEHTSTSSG